MKLRKNDRVVATVPQGSYLGVVLKTGERVEMVLDDGRIGKFPTASVARSDVPVPPDSPLARLVLDVGAPVSFVHQRQTVTGRLISGDAAYARVMTYTAEYKVPQGALTRCPAPPAEPASPMDAWGLAHYEAFDRMSEETTAFTAEVTHDGKKVLSARNDGRGGGNIYHLHHQLDLDAPDARAFRDRFEADARAWCEAHGDFDPYEASDVWVTYAANYKPFGFTATEFFTEYWLPAVSPRAAPH